MSEKLPPVRVLRYIDDQYWAMLPSAYAAMREVVAGRVAGVQRSPEDIRASIDAAQKMAYASAPGTVALLNLQGVLTPRADMITEYSGGTSLESFQAVFRAAVAEPSVEAIVINAHTPGGSVYQCQETADLIYGSRGVKPIYGIANCMAASAGYWILSQCDQLWVTASGEVGSVGVILNHRCYQKMNEMEGVESVYLTYGKNKAEGNPDEPLEQEAVDFYMSRLAEYGQAFDDACARGRNVKASVVRANFGQGRVFSSKMAMAAGMVDKVGSLHDLLARVMKKGKGGMRASAEDLPAVAAEAEAPDSVHLVFEKSVTAFRIPEREGEPVTDAGASAFVELTPDTFTDATEAPSETATTEATVAAARVRVAIARARSAA